MRQKTPTLLKCFDTYSCKSAVICSNMGLKVRAGQKLDSKMAGWTLKDEIRSRWARTAPSLRRLRKSAKIKSSIHLKTRFWRTRLEVTEDCKRYGLLESWEIQRTLFVISSCHCFLARLLIRFEIKSFDQLRIGGWSSRYRGGCMLLWALWLFLSFVRKRTTWETTNIFQVDRVLARILPLH